MKKLGIVVSVIIIVILGIFISGKLLGGHNETLVNKEVLESDVQNNEEPTTKRGENDDDDNQDKTKKGFVIENIDGVTYIDGVLIVNKTYSVPENYVPTDPYTSVNNQKYCQTCINKDVYEAFKEMKADAQAIGLNIYIQSGYRSYEAQQMLYENYVNNDGKDTADTYSARAGNSEHQTGLAFDLNTITDDFAYTPEGKWINEYAYKYGFILRYPKTKESITGYKYEPWHLRYVGKELAEKLYNKGEWITLEEYFGIDSQYPD